MTAEEAYKLANIKQVPRPDLEPFIITDSFYATYYAINSLKVPWPEAEPIIATNTEHAWAYFHNFFKPRGYRRFELAEPLIMKSEHAVEYAFHSMGKPWPEAEEFIAKSPKLTYDYACNLINGRFYPGELGEWDDAELAFRYAKTVMRTRWPKVEELIAHSKYKGMYLNFFFPDTEVVTKDQVSFARWVFCECEGYFAPADLFPTKISILDMQL